MTPIDIMVSEVGPRDGLQSIKRLMPTAAKLRWIKGLADAGLREIEVGSFVSPKLLPQMADAEDVVAQAIRIPDLTVLALVPNLKGATHAFAAGVHKVTMPVSASRLHSKANINVTPKQAIEAVQQVCQLRDSIAAERRPKVEAGVSTAFGCTLEGPISEDWVMEIAALLAAAGADTVNLSDTTGMGNPTQVKRMFKRLKAELGVKAGGAHLHNTRGQGLAMLLPRSMRGSRPSTPRMPDLEDVPMRPGRPETLSPKISSFCWSRWGCGLASISTD